jgi:hypothetical protein
MTISLRPSGVSIPGIDRNAAAMAGISCPWLRLPLDEQGSTSSKIETQGTVITGEEDIANSVTNTWNNLGWLSVSSASGNQIAIPGTDEFARLDNLGQGGLLVAFDHYFTDDFSGTHTILSANPTDGTNGGWRIDRSGSTLFWRVKQKGSGSFTTMLTFGNLNVANTWHNGRIATMLYVDAANGQAIAYLRRTGKTDKTDTTDISAYSMPGLGDDGLGVLCKIETGNVPSVAEYYGVSGTGRRVGNIIMIRPTVDISGDLPTFFEQFWTYRHQLPYVVRDWV